ncbi:MAG: hypothetical protein KJO85_07145 [Gammaproteobacteria bacterium]|nr:hypothetical protein [Gammaproteobacteria bacterium]
MNFGAAYFLWGFGAVRAAGQSQFQRLTRAAIAHASLVAAVMAETVAYFAAEKTWNRPRRRSI